MYAIIENGSKQYKVANGEIVNLEKLSNFVLLASVFDACFG